MPLLERERLQLHDQPQQPHAQLFRCSGLGGVDDLVVDRGQRGGFGDLSGDPIHHPDLLMIQIATPERLPHAGQVIAEPPGARQQAAHLVGLLTQDHGQLVGHKLTRLGPVRLRHFRVRSGSTLVRDPHIGVSDGRFASRAIAAAASRRASDTASRASCSRCGDPPSRVHARSSHRHFSNARAIETRNVSGNVKLTPRGGSAGPELYRFSLINFTSTNARDRAAKQPLTTTTRRSTSPAILQ
jgi:hypothetical protein